MANVFSIERVTRRLLRMGARRVVRPLRVEGLEDRSVPSTTIPLSGVQWTPIGPSPVTATQVGDHTVAPNNLPTGGRAVSVAADPTQPSIFYVATNGGGVAKTTDGGQTYTFLTDNLPATTPVWLNNPPGDGAGTITTPPTVRQLGDESSPDRTLKMGAIGVSPLNPNLVFAGEGDPTDTQYGYAGKGLLRSTDGGQTWVLIKGPDEGNGQRAFSDTSIVKIVFHPTDVNTIFVVTGSSRMVPPNSPPLNPLGNTTMARYGHVRDNKVWRTRDGGQTWVDVTQQLFQASQPSFTVNRRYEFTDFSLDNTNPDVGYLAIGNPDGYNLNGVYRTDKVTTGDPTIGDLTDPNSIRWVPRLGGTSTFSPGLSNPIGVVKVTPAPGLPSTVYALLGRAGGGQLAVYKSTDSGVNWVRLLAADAPSSGNTGSAFTNPGANAFDLVVDPAEAIEGGDRRVFIVGRNGIALTEDGGFTWRNVSTDAAGDGPYPVITNARFDANRRLLVTTDAGVFRLNTWQSPAPLDWVAVNGRPGPSGPDGVGGLGATDLLFNAIPPGADQFVQAGLAPQGSDNIIGTTWLNGTVNFSDPGGFGANPAPLYGWPATDPTVENGGNVVYDFLRPNIVYKTGLSTQVEKSTDGGRTWTQSVAGVTNPGALFGDPAPPLEMDPSNSSRLLYGTDMINESGDGAQTWGTTNLPSGAQYDQLPFVTGQALNPRISKIAVGRQNGAIVYVAVTGRTYNPGSGPVDYGPAIYMWDPAYKASDNKTHWLDVSPGRVGDPRMPGDPDVPSGQTAPVPNGLGGQPSDLEVDPNDSKVLYLTVDKTGAGRVYRSAGPGIVPTWSDLTGDLPSDPNAFRAYTVAVDPRVIGAPVGFTDDDVYVGTENGLWKLTNPVGSTHWSRVGAITTQGGTRELPDVMVRDVELDTTQGILSVATMGRGVWQYQIRPYISGFAFEDLNGNGARDTGEGPLSGIKVRAIIPAGAPNNPTGTDIEFANTTTRSDGFYAFRSLPDGTYRIEVGNTLTQQYQLTTPIQVYTVTPTTTITTGDLGIFVKTSISGVKFNDLNGNGVRDAGEPGLGGWTIRLLDDQGNPVNDPNTGQPITTTTAPDGTYTFTNLGVLPLVRNPGPGVPPYQTHQYEIQEVGQAGWVATASDTRLIPPLRSGTPSTGNDLANFRTITIGGRKFEDVNGDGVQGAGEPGLAGWVITLQRTDPQNNVTTVQTTTDANGNYSFTGQGPGSYVVREVAQNGWGQVTADVPAFSAISGQDRTVNFGNFRVGSIAGTLFEDVNGNGVRDVADNTPLGGVTIGLFDPSQPAGSPPIQTTTTNANGQYSFSNLIPLQRPGNTVPYLVRVIPPPTNLSQTIPDRQAILTSGSAANGVDLLAFRRGSASGVAYEDVNGNGVRDAGEGVLPNFTVALFDAATGAQLATAQTDVNGNFTFDDLPPGSGAPVPPFRVGVGQLGWVQTGGAGAFTVTSGGAVGGLSVGAFRVAQFTGVKFEDVNGNGVRDAGEPGLAGWTIQLVNASTGVAVASTTTDANGRYVLTAGPGSFTVREVNQGGWVQTTPLIGTFNTSSRQVIGGQDIGNFRQVTVSGVVFFDQDGNGRQNGAAEGPLAGFTVELIDANGTIRAAATTDANGRYAFSGVGPGQFQVVEVPPPGWSTSTPNPVPISPSSGQDVVVSFGNFRVASIFGTVFEDLDQSGTQDAGEPAAAGQPVNLIASDGSIFRTVTTDANGAYAFTDLPGGTYAVRLGSRPGWIQTTADPSNVSPRSAESVFGGTFGVLRLGSIAGTVFRDSNRNFKMDPWETSLPGAVVGLYDAGGNLIAQQAVGPDGKYNFLALPAGTYTVKLVSTPPGLTTTTPSGGKFTDGVVTGSVNPGNSFTGQDFGLIGRKRFALAADGGGGPRVQVFDAGTGQKIRDFFVYEETFTGGVRVASGDVNGDGVDDLVVVAGPGGGPRVRVLDGVTGDVIFDYFVYEESFRDGMYVAVGDVNGDGYADIITGTAPNGGPRVAVFDGKTGNRLADFFAFDSTFRGGVRIGAADVNGDGKAEVITGMGPGGPPLVRVWNPLTGQQVSSFFAFDQSFTGGVFVSGGAYQTNGNASIIVGSGAGLPNSRVREFDATGRTLTDTDAFSILTGPYTGDARVSSVDKNGDGVPDIAIASGAGSPSRVRFLDGKTKRQIGDELMPFEATFLGGVFIG